MATTNSITTTYAGEFAGEYIAAALTSGKTLNDGAIAIKPNVKFKEVLKNVSLTDAIKDATCDFDPTSTVSLTERVLQPKELQVNMQLCKSDFRSDWEALSMGFSAHDSLPPNFSDFIIGHVSAKVAESVENNIWQGDDSASSGFNLFEGFEQLISSSSLSGVGASTLTSGNVITFLGKVVDNIPSAVYGLEDLTIYLPNNAYQAYVRALGGFASNVGAAGIDNKGTTFYGMNEGLTFDGIKLQRCPGMSSNRAVAAQSSNLYFGTGLLADHNEVKLIDMADIDGSQNVRLVMRFTAGTQVGVLSDAKHFTPAS
tara:strand:- start:3899 stop:4840 length:942 start_codon:yes stop_codon:yes gene_type:complete